MFRGILTTIYCSSNKHTIKSVIKTLKNYYKKEIFVKILNKNKLISTNDVINTNNCLISVFESKQKNHFIILCAIDNLIKGGSGQAIQNLNIIYKLKRNMGLE